MSKLTAPDITVCAWCGDDLGDTPFEQTFCCVDCAENLGQRAILDTINEYTKARGEDPTK